MNLVEGTGWNEFIELNRMAFDNYLPKYSESRCIAISIKLIKKKAIQYPKDSAVFRKDQEWIKGGNQ